MAREVRCRGTDRQAHTVTLAAHAPMVNKKVPIPLIHNLIPTSLFGHINSKIISGLIILLCRASSIMEQEN